MLGHHIPLHISFLFHSRRLHAKREKISTENWVVFVAFSLPESVILCNNPVYVSHFHVADHHPFYVGILAAKEEIGFKQLLRVQFEKKLVSTSFPHR
jgi:hypothetical protein